MRQSEARSASRTTSSSRWAASSISVSPYASTTYSAASRRLAARVARAPAPDSGSPSRPSTTSSTSTVSSAGGSMPRASHRSASRASSSAEARAKASSSGAPACQRYVPPPSASATGCSMKETPLPLTVRATRAFGVSSSSRNRANVVRSAAWSWPSAVATCQPKARSFDSMSPSATISSVGLSDCTSLRSTTIQRRPRRACAAACSASQFCPSWSSPSPVMTTASPRRRRRRFARAIPRPFEIPMPSDPEFASIPGTPTSGWPSSPPSRRSRSSRSRGTTPRAKSAAYRPGTSWPLEEKKTSRSGSSKPRSATSSASNRRCTTTSSALKVEPRCPEPARFTATSAFNRHASARSASLASGSTSAPRSRSSSSLGTRRRSGMSDTRP